MARAGDGHRRRVAVALTALALIAGCGRQPQRHNEAENEFTAWANDVERESDNGQAATPDFEEPSNVMERAVPGNAH